MMWDVFFDIGSEFTVTVLSGTVMIGNITIQPEDLTCLPQNIEGLTIFDGYLRTDADNRMDDTGRIQIVCRLEAHVESDGEDPDSDDDLMFEFDTKNSMLGLPRQVVPRVSKCSVIAVALNNLVPMHKMLANSPSVVVACGGWNARSEVLKITNLFCCHCRLESYVFMCDHRSTNLLEVPLSGLTFRGRFKFGVSRSSLYWPYLEIERLENSRSQQETYLTLNRTNPGIR
jgi:hypothetical protein